METRPLVMNQTIPLYGWRATQIGIGIAIVVLMLPHSASPALVDEVRTAAGLSYLISILSLGVFVAFMRLAVREMDQTVVMVTHDPVAASYADRVVFLVDGRIVDEVLDPTTDSVMDAMRDLTATTTTGRP